MRIARNGRPRPLSTCWLYRIAVPTGEQAGVIADLGLTRPIPVTFAEAEAVIDEDGHGEAEDDPDGLAQVYVSPEIEGWTLVIGPWCDPCSSDRSDEVLRLCIGVSSRYGVAQVYYFGTQNDGSAWLIAEHGGAMLRTCGSAPGGTWRAYLPERAAGLAMVFKLVEAAQARWRAVNGAHLVPLVRAGARFERGRLVEHPEAVAA